VFVFVSPPLGLAMLATTLAASLIVFDQLDDRQLRRNWLAAKPPIDNETSKNCVHKHFS
jgi:hypothetical protein